MARKKDMLPIATFVTGLLFSLSSYAADGIKIFESGSRRVHVEVFCSNAEDREKIKFQRLHLEEQKSGGVKIDLSGQAPFESILVTRDEHFRVGEDQDFTLTTVSDGEDEEIPLYLVERDGSVIPYSVNVKSIAPVVKPPSELPAKAAPAPEPAPKTGNAAKTKETEVTPEAQPPAPPQETKNETPPPAPRPQAKPIKKSELDRKIFRRNPLEAEIRISGEAYNQSVVLLGGLSLSGWIGKRHDFLVKTPHWGAEADYDLNVTKITDANGNSSNLSKLVVEVKYNVLHSVSNRETLFGPLLAYQNFSFVSQASNMAGLGAFVSIPIYGGTEKVMNYLNLFRHPKWIDGEVQYFFKTLDSTSITGPTFNATGRLKIYFKPWAYFHVGLVATFAQYATSPAVTASTSYLTGTLGLGANF